MRISTILCWLLIPVWLSAQPLHIRFGQVGINEGLSQSTVTCILQDKKGFLWFGTKDGLDRYDGYQFVVYKKSFNSSNCLSSNDIKSLLEDGDGKIWISTSAGSVDRFDPVTGKFTHYYKGTLISGPSGDHVRCLYEDRQGKIWLAIEGVGFDRYDRRTGEVLHFPFGEKDISDNTINAFCQDSRGDTWIATDKHGLCRWDPLTGHREWFRYDPGNPHSLSDNNVQFIHEDRHKNLWVGTYGGGLDLFDPVARTFQSYRQGPGVKENSFRNKLLSVAEDAKGILWIGTENGGLEAFDPAALKATSYIHQDADNTSLSSNTVNCVAHDSKGNIWIGLMDGGINMINKDASHFAHYKYGPGNNIINCLYEDKAGRLWIATDGGGLRRFDRVTKKFIPTGHDNNDLQTTPGDYVLSICEDAGHRIWSGTWGDGVSVMDPVTGRTRQFKSVPGNPHSLSSNYAFALLRDSRDRVWIGTYGGGLDQYDPATDRFIRYSHDPADSNSISNNYILTLREDKQGRLWIGTDGGGLNVFDPQTGHFRAYKHEDKKPLSSNSIRTIWEDAAGMLWLGTNFGLNRFDPATGASTAYFTQNGLPDDWVTGVLGDKHGALWISTTKGLSRFEPGSGSFQNFTMSDGLQGYEFKSGYLCRDGQMYFGGKNGFNEFNPDSIRSNPFDPPIVFTGFQIFNKEVEVGINDAKEIVLTHDQSVISFEFASLNYTGREKKAYSYMLEGFDHGWHELGPKNSVTYTNIDPGSYTLRVRGLTNDGRWSAKEASIQLTFLPPYWKTWWFRALAVLSVTGLVVLLFYRRIASIKNHNRLLEQQVASRTHELQEANHTKDRFFSILAHDLKNPVSALTGISDMLKRQLPSLSNEVIYDHVDTLHKASGSIGNLLNNLLDWARTQTQHISCTPGDINVFDLVRKNQALVEAQIRDKNIRFEVDVPPAHILWADPQMIDTVLRNIISNSIKFTPPCGRITVHSEDCGGQIAIVVSDTGIGMTAEQMATIYAIKPQRPTDGTAGEKGTGLGLIIAKEFIEINQGTIQIESEPGRGSSFRILCPGVSDHSGGTPAPASIGIAELQPHSAAFAEASFDMDSYTVESTGDGERPRVLLVDDNEQIRNYLKLLLAGHFEIIEAANGGQGIDAARDYQPTVIISDMLMPVMNGLEFCTRIKEDKATSHIPVIILTSQTSHESQLSGYEAGADVYLMKDVNRHVLFQVILNFIRNQEKLSQRFAQSAEIYPEGLDLNQVDKEFLEEVIRFVEENLSEPDLDYKKICSHTAMSRTVLYAKFKTLTGQGVHDFIKSIRVKKGLQLLQEGRLNVTQIAYEVGFSTPSYFSKSFTKQFGLPPKEYLSELKKRTVQDV